MARYYDENKATRARTVERVRGLSAQAIARLKLVPELRNLEALLDAMRDVSLLVLDASRYVEALLDRQEKRAPTGQAESDEREGG